MRCKTNSKKLSSGLGSKQGTPWELFAAGLLSLSLVALLTVLLLIGWQGLSYFWPMPVYQFEVQSANTKDRFYGRVYSTQLVASAQLQEAGTALENENKRQERLLLNIGSNQGERGDFVTFLSQDIVLQVKPEHLAVVERRYQGDFYGIPLHYTKKGQIIASSLTSASLNQRISDIKEMQQSLHLLHSQLLHLNEKKEDIQRQLNSVAPLSQAALPLLKEAEELNKNIALVEKKRAKLQENFLFDELVFIDSKDQQVAIPITDILQIWYPNQMNGLQKFQHWLMEVIDFVSNDAQKSSQEAGIFPAIFGTILMVFIMSVLVMPLGVLAAIYLHEYAKKNTVIRLVRIAVANLAGVPSIVYGVFGLGFFVYFLGTNIDELFYAESLPTPTFGTPGLLWSSLTLGLLTLPVVIVSVEEGLKRIPISMRHASLALGATQSEVLRTLVLPMLSPAIMTGLILAIARAAGEVAPLMLVGVVKLAQSLPLDAEFPYLHLDRKFMHLGYHIYDLSLRSANLEAIKPLVYATSLLLLLVVIGLNLTAVMIRHHLREKYRMLEQIF